MKLKIKNGKLQPEYVEACTLYTTIQDATDKLAQLARVELSNPDKKIYPHAAVRLVESQLMAVRKAVELLASLAPDEPCFLSHELLRTMTGAVREFEDAIRLRPKQFATAARQ
jgi:hypothetical protein